MQYQYQIMNFWLTTRGAVLQFSHQDMVALDNTKPVSTCYYRTCTHGSIVTLEILLLQQYQPSCTVLFKLKCAGLSFFFWTCFAADIYSNGDTS